MLEILVHANLAVPPKHHQVVRIAIPDSVAIETLSPSALPGWDAEDASTDIKRTAQSKVARLVFAEKEQFKD